jgi:hypothetical protein
VRSEKRFTGFSRDYRSDLFMSIGTHPKYNSGNTYYSIEYVERARELLSQRKEKRTDY